MYIVVEIFDNNEMESYKPSFYKIDDDDKREKEEIEDIINKIIRENFSHIEDNYYDEYFLLDIYYIEDEDFEKLP